MAEETTDRATGGPQERVMGWQQWGISLGVLVALATLYGAVVAPARDSARESAQVAAKLSAHDARLSAIEEEAQRQRTATAERYDLLRDRIEAAGKETAALRLDLVTIRGQLGVLLERTKGR